MQVTGSAAPKKHFFPHLRWRWEPEGQAEDSWGQKIPQPLKGELFLLLNYQLQVLMPLLWPSFLNWVFIYVQHKQIIVYVHPNSKWSMNAELCRKVQRVVGHLGEVLTHYGWKDHAEEEESGVGIQQAEPAFSVRGNLRELCPVLTIWHHC